jgi:hypothetical protein
LEEDEDEAEEEDGRPIVRFIQLPVPVGLLLLPPSAAAIQAAAAAAAG